MTSNQENHAERNRSESSTSHFFYDNHETLDHKMQSFIDTVEAAPPKNFKTLQSRPLPYWAWYIIAKVNGVPLSENEKPIFGTFIHVFTFLCALAYVVSYTWYVAYDISANTPRDVPGGTVSIFLVMCWCTFGYYCKSLSSRLFFHRRFLRDVRLHSRTVFKINASLLVLFLGSLVTAANVIEALSFMKQENCNNIDLDILVCTILTVSDVFFSILTLVWHSLVSFVFLSVCRTHTIGLRRFIKEIENDAAMYRRKCSKIYKKFPRAVDEIWEDESLWLVEDAKQSGNKKSPLNLKKDKSQYSPRQRRQGEISILLSPVVENVEQEQFDGSLEHEDYDTICKDQTNANSSQVRQMESLTNEDEGLNQTMSQSEILHHHFRLNCRLRFSACALQRWFASFIALVLLRCSTYLVHWLGHTASVLDVIQFSLPLILLVVLSSAIAEVNFEGNRVWRCLYPTQGRIKMLQYLTANPLVMPIYGFGMTHGTIVTVVFAILVGFVTRIIMTELTEMSQKKALSS